MNKFITTAASLVNMTAQKKGVHAAIAAVDNNLLGVNTLLTNVGPTKVCIKLFC
jgi:hypothetical protein